MALPLSRRPAARASSRALEVDQRQRRFQSEKRRNSLRSRSSGHNEPRVIPEMGCPRFRFSAYGLRLVAANHNTEDTSLKLSDSLAVSSLPLLSISFPARS